MCNIYFYVNIYTFVDNLSRAVVRNEISHWNDILYVRKQLQLSFYLTQATKYFNIHEIKIAFKEWKQSVAYAILTFADVMIPCYFFILSFFSITASIIMRYYL